jgi:nitrate reductase gamma subunit
MSGIVWHIVTLGAVIIFLVIIVYRAIAIVRLPVHLRWELAPIPHEKGKGGYGGSYLEEFEWWRRPRRRSRIAPIIYMFREIFLLKGIWKNNRALALAGYLLGGSGAIGLILKRALDAGYRPFTTVTRYLHLVFLSLVFFSGIYAWFATGDFARETSAFIKSLVTIDTGITAAFPLSMHFIICLLFIIYLPLTDMAHFMAKYFTYHYIRWNDTPQNEKMTRELQRLLTQPVGWSATHVPARGQKSWADTAGVKTDDGKKN